MSAHHDDTSAARQDVPDSQRPGLFSDERQNAILAEIIQRGRVSVTSLAEQFSVVGETIRRDLGALEKRGVIRRVHGGATLAGRAEFESPIHARANLMAGEKERIANAALAEMPVEGSVFVEAGSTSSFLASVMPSDPPLTIVTNGGYLASVLAQGGSHTVLSVGGRVRQRTLACVDDWALRTLSGLHVAVAFLGTNGISLDGGLTTPDLAEAAVKRATLAVGERTILLADHSKIGVASLTRYGELDQIDLLITDTGLPEEDAQELEGAGLSVIRV
jgi:DeoR family fructose operon transcriptional repressor